MVYESSFLISEEWVPQEETEIGLLEMLNDQLVRDACTYPKFLCDFSIRHPLTFQWGLGADVYASAPFAASADTTTISRITVHGLFDGV
jgi:hypothetical protein